MKASPKMTTRIVPETVYKQIAVRDGIVLDLTEKEAGALLKVLNNVGGDPKRSPRGLVANIEQALSELDVEPIGQIDSSSSYGGSLYFRNW